MEISAQLFAYQAVVGWWVVGGVAAVDSRRVKQHTFLPITKPSGCNKSAH